MLWFLFGVGILGGIIWGVAKSTSGYKEQLPYSVLTINGDGGFDFDIVGEASYQQALESIAGRSDESAEHYCTATLSPEPSNQYDSNAIRVDINGKTVGYIARGVTAEFHRVLRGRSAQANAIIVGGWSRGSRGSGHFGVKLDIDEPISVS